MKVCSKCKKYKNQSDFYKRSGSIGELRSNCKSCMKEYLDNRVELKRLYDKTYNDNNKENISRRGKIYKAQNPDVVYKCVKKYNSKYPEKLKAKNKANKNLTSIKGMHRHHWSYLEEHQLDIIYVDASLHSYYHTKLEYDSERMIYRVKATGELLDTKQKHSSFLLELLMQEKRLPPDEQPLIY